jgi:DNA polymerase elongation subunit (family B)
MSNVVLAAFTTAYARLKLCEVLDMLQERVLYYDTDSVIFVSKPDEPDPPLG